MREAELGLDHGEGCFDVRSLVVVRQEFLTLIHEKDGTLSLTGCGSAGQKRFGFRPVEFFLNGM